MSAAAVTGRLGDVAFVTDEVIPVVGSDGLLAGGVAVAGDTRAQLEPRWAAPIKSARGFSRALCRLSTLDGITGVAWCGGS
jgi:hypothetical protein